MELKNNIYRTSAREDVVLERTSFQQLENLHFY